MGLQSLSIMIDPNHNLESSGAEAETQATCAAEEIHGLWTGNRLSP
jgi:hypothetical protein